MAKYLNTESEEVIIGNEGNVVQHSNGIDGGVFLDLTGFSGDLVQEGLVVVKTASTGVYKPLAVTSGAYPATIPTGTSVVGVITASTEASAAMFPVTTRGRVYQGQAPVAYNDAIRTALPHIEWAD